MAEDSKIQWTDATWNPWHGCTKVSPGCKFCYMYRDKERYKQDPTTVIKSKANFEAPLKWAGKPGLCMASKRLAKQSLPDGSKIFTCSWSDFFIEDADEWRSEAWKIIKRTPEFQYQILTKRPERILECLPSDWGEGYPNVWLGVSAEDHDQWNIRVHQLMRIPAKVRFVSIEPFLGPLYWGISVELSGKDMGRPVYERGLDWVIIGGESGNDTGKYRYRPSEIGWYEFVIDYCKKYNVPVFMKQLGTHLSKQLKLKDRHGGDISEWPDELKVREFPK